MPDATVQIRGPLQVNETAANAEALRLARRYIDKTASATKDLGAEAREGGAR